MQTCDIVFSNVDTDSRNDAGVVFVWCFSCACRVRVLGVCDTKSLSSKILGHGPNPCVDRILRLPVRPHVGACFCGSAGERPNLYSTFI
jgi:hypothetical protein